MEKVIVQCRGIPSLFVLLLLIVAASTETEKKCGTRKLSGIALIVGGTEVLPGDWPWHVALFRRGRQPKPEYQCGGTIISKHFALTAAHCFVTLDPAEYFFKAGIFHLHNDSDPNVVTYSLSEIIVHPSYNPRLFHNDIALMRPDRVISFESNVAPICLMPKKSSTLAAVVNQLGIVAGFGKNAQNKLSETLQQTAIRLLPVKQCTEKLQDHDHYLVKHEGKICGAGSMNGVGVCNGDSGGGFYFAEQLSSPVWFIQGIVSAGTRKDNVHGTPTCDVTRPAGYTNVTKYVGWIEAHEKILTERNLLQQEECGAVNHASVSDEAQKPVFNQYPWNALLEYRHLAERAILLLCGGVLVHPRFVLTIGHCVDAILSQYKLTSVRLGEFNIQTTKDSDPSVPNAVTTTQSIDIETIILHPNFHKPSYSNDLALVKLKYNADISKSNIKPICLPHLDDFKQSGLTLSGWKRDKDSFPKQERDSMNITSNAECLSEYKKRKLQLPLNDHVVCTIYNNRPKGKCHNYATGSSLQYIKVVDKTPRYFLAGLMIFSMPYCTMNGSDVFVNLNSATEWIKGAVFLETLQLVVNNKKYSINKRT